MCHLGREKCTVHLMFSPDQPGRIRMYHYIIEATSILSKYIHISTMASYQKPQCSVPRGKLLLYQSARRSSNLIQESRSLSMICRAVGIGGSGVKAFLFKILSVKIRQEFVTFEFLFSCKNWEASIVYLRVCLIFLSSM